MALGSLLKMPRLRTAMTHVRQVWKLRIDQMKSYHYVYIEKEDDSSEEDLCLHVAPMVFKSHKYKHEGALYRPM